MEKLSSLLTSALLFYVYVTNYRTDGVSQQALCFPIIGDFGGIPYAPYTTTTQRRVADYMAKVAAQGNCQFIVALGDNFYHTGVRHDDDPRFHLTFERVYSSPSLNVPWYIIAGNHDHIQNVSAQIAYTKKSHRWHFPSLFYSKVYKIPGSSKEVHLVMIDTTLLCWTNKHKKHSLPSAQEQLQWINQELSKSKSEYLIVAGHHPVLSAGVHGNTDCLVVKLKPLLEKYSVSAYFSGHDHNLQHIHDALPNIHYFVSGSGNFYNGWAFNKQKLPHKSLKFFHGISGGFAVVEALENALQLQFINEMDKTIYRTTITPRQRRQSDVRRYPDILMNFLKSPIKTLSKLLAQDKDKKNAKTLRTWNFFS